MEKDQYKSFQGVIRIWCFLKWRRSEVVCAEQMSVETADVTATLDGKRLGFVFMLNKTTDFLKTQIINCRKTCDKVYLVTNEIDLNNIPKAEDELSILNLADRYGLGNMVEEL